jgi:hypothetical protein
MSIRDSCKELCKICSRSMRRFCKGCYRDRLVREVRWLVSNLGKLGKLSKVYNLDKVERLFCMGKSSRLMSRDRGRCWRDKLRLLVSRFSSRTREFTICISSRLLTRSKNSNTYLHSSSSKTASKCNNSTTNRYSNSINYNKNK